MGFRPATKEKSKLRFAVMGPSGSGKTFTGLSLATSLGKKIAVIDSERGSASKYADLFKFDVCDLDNHSPETYCRAIKEAESAGYDVILIDSLSHAWAGKDGALELVDKANKRSNSGNSFAAWREVTPLHTALVDAMISSKCHVIATMRTKTEYVLEENDKGKKVPKKMGMAPIQRDGVEYEFDVTADMNLEHDLIVAKTRCNALDGYVQRKPGKELADILLNWLDAGAAPSPKPAGNTTSTAGPAAAESRTDTTEKAASAAGSETPKPNAPAQDSGKSGETTGTTVQKVGPDQMTQLLTAGEANGWSKKQISEFVCYAFKLTPKTIVNEITWPQWEIAVKVVSQPGNKGGVVTVTADGKEVKPEHRWPKAG